MFKREGTNFNCFDTIKTKKAIRRDHLRHLIEEKCQQPSTSSPEVERSDSTLDQTNHEQRLLSNGPENQVQKLPEVYNNLKSKAQTCEKNLSEKIVFATKSGSEVKEVLSEYGERLRRDRKMRESAPIMLECATTMLEHLEDNQTDSSPSNRSTTSSDSSSGLREPLLKASKKSNRTEDELTQFRTKVESLRSQLERGDIAQAMANHKKISEQIAAWKSAESELTQFRTKVESFCSQLERGDMDQVMADHKKISEQIAILKKENTMTTDVQKRIINTWEQFDLKSQNGTENQNGKVNTDNPEIMSLYLEHVLAEARGKTLTETVNRLRELHGFLINRIGHDVENNSIVANIEISNYSKETTSKPIDSLQEPFTKQERNEILWSYVTSIEDLIKLKCYIKENESKNQPHVERTNNDSVHEIETSKQEDIRDKSIQDSVWPPLNAHEIKQHYPEGVKLRDVRSVLYNSGKQKLDQLEHEQRLKAIALRTTEWLIDHTLDVSSNDAKKELRQKVENLFNENRKEKAIKLFECIVRQEKKDKQAWITRASHYVANATPFTYDKLQVAKKELVGILKEHSARYDYINRKSLQFHELPWNEKIGKRGSGYRYEGSHKSEREHLAKEISFQESLKRNKDETKNKWPVEIDEFNNLYKDLQDKTKKGEKVKKAELLQLMCYAQTLLLGMIDEKQEETNLRLQNLTSVIQRGQEMAGNKASTMIGIQSGVVTGVWSADVFNIITKILTHGAG